MSKIRNGDQAVCAADDALFDVEPDTSDETIAGVVADFYLIGFQSPGHFVIFHDVPPSASHKRQREHKQLVGEWDSEKAGERDKDLQPIGPCPLPYDWSYKNTVGVSTRDPKRARQWCIDAMLAGYSVFRAIGSYRSGGFGHGTLAEIRA